MGQYFKAVNITSSQAIEALAHDNGMKLMEHSWIGNNYVAAAEALLAKGGAWYGHRIVWAGDYAEPKPGKETNVYLDQSLTVLPATKLKKTTYRYLLNRTMKTYIDKTDIPAAKSKWDDWQWIIHPLPLLTSEGNGQGGGDFRGNDPRHLIGLWRGHVIEPTNTKPMADYHQLLFDLVE